jgi:hypothetical protein
MGCLYALGTVLAPRLIMVVLWLFTDYLSRAFDTFLWPFLGFVFLPTTTMAYAIAENAYGGVEGWGLAIVIVGVIVDFGLLGGSGRALGRRLKER